MERTFDEDTFPDAWRINSSDCKISENEKKALVFLNPTQSLELWRRHVSNEFFHLMKIPFADKGVLRKLTLYFSSEAEGSHFFKKELRRYELVIFFGVLEAHVWFRIVRSSITGLIFLPVRRELSNIYTKQSEKNILL